MSSLSDGLGVARVLSPRGALPQTATRIDPSGPVRPWEIEIAVEMLCLDSTSFRQISESVDGDVAEIAAAIAAIVADRGKMHNPVTGSGGILTGTVTAVGSDFRDPPALGTHVVTLASLTLTPLELTSVGPLDGRSPRVPVTGNAYLPWTASWTTLPADLPIEATLAALDVCNAASETRRLIEPSTGTTLVLGGGHAGLLALAATRDTSRRSRVILMDANPRICNRAAALGLCDAAITADLRDPVAALQALEHSGADRADLTIVVVNATNCEPAAVLLTNPGGTVLFFSMATSFTQAALSAEGMSSTARLLLGSGYAPDRGDYALELVRGNEGLRQIFAEAERT